MDEEANRAERPAMVDGPDGVERVPADESGTDPRAGIEEVVAGLDALGDVPLSEHVTYFEAVHTELTAALSSIDKV